MSLKFTAAVLFIITALSGCYRMPTDDDFSLIPTTNNPDITRDSGNSLVPGSNF